MKYKIFHESNDVYYAAVVFDKISIKERFDCTLAAKENKGFGVYDCQIKAKFGSGTKEYLRFFKLRAGVTDRVIYFNWFQNEKIKHYPPRVITARESNSEFDHIVDTDLWIMLTPKKDKNTTKESNYQILYKVVVLLESLEKTYKDPPCKKCLHGFSLQILNGEHLKCEHIFTKIDPTARNPKITNYIVDEYF